MADIIFIVDESGSMDDQRSTVISSLNEFVSEQKRKAETNEALKNAVVHIYKFSSEVSPPISHRLATFPTLTKDDYKPDGLTALYDAIGIVMSKFKEGDNKRIVVIITDGENNSSKEYRQAHIRKRMSAARESGKWEIIYLSESAETQKQGENLGITRCYVSATKDKKGAMCSAMRGSAFNSMVTTLAVGGSKTRCDELESAFVSGF